MRGFSAALLSAALLVAATAPSWSRNPAHLPSAKKSAQPVPTLKVTSRLVVVDVVVTKGGRPVAGLQQSDFALYEDGVRQTIRNFTPHFATMVASALAAAPPALPPDTWTNLPIAHATDSVTVLLLDNLNTAPGDVLYVNREMIRYLKKPPPGQRIAVFVLGQRLQMLQGFTADTSRLLAAFKKAGAASPASLLPPGEQNLDEAEELDNMRAAQMSPLVIARTNNWMGEADASQTAMRVHITLQAMQQLSRYLGGVPGRKNLVWFSGSFPLQFFSIVDIIFGPGQINPQIAPIGDFNQELKQTADMLAAARVAVYPVDARGVLLEPMFTSTQSPSPTTTQSGDFTPALGSGGPEGGSFGTDLALSPRQRATEHDTMDVLAQQTGGRAVYESNGLQKAMADALSDGSNFYTLAYVPTNTNYNGAQRNVRIRLTNGDKVKLFYRRSYYADAGDPLQSGAAQDSRSVFLASMRRGVPASSQIVFDVRVAAPDRTPPTGPVDGANSAMQHRAARYAIDYAADLHAIDLTRSSNGLRQGRLDALALAWDSNGKLLNWVSNDLSISLDQAQWDQYSRYGIQIHQVLDLPAGQVVLRVGLYDPASGHFGSMEIPLRVKAVKTLTSSPK